MSENSVTYFGGPEDVRPDEPEKPRMDDKLILKCLYVAKAALENERRFTQKLGSEDDSNLNHDAIFHIDRAISLLDKHTKQCPTTAPAPETPKMDESANGLWWMKPRNEWVIARLEFKRLSVGAAKGELITARMFHHDGISDTALGYQSELDAAQWGGRIIPPTTDEQPKPL